MRARPPPQPAERLRALRGLKILDTPPDQAFDDIARLAACVCHAPIAMINFVDEDRQWAKAMVGTDCREVPIDVSFCSHTILAPVILVVPDTLEDPRFADNPLVTGPPYLRFYAGAVLQTRSDHSIGTVCVADVVPRQLDEGEREALLALAVEVMDLLDLHRSLVKTAAWAAKLERTVRARDDELVAASHGLKDALTVIMVSGARLARELARTTREPPPGPLESLKLAVATMDRLISGLLDQLVTAPPARPAA